MQEGIVSLLHNTLCLYRLQTPRFPQIELVQDFMAVLITGKSDEDSIKNEIAVVLTTFSEVYGALKGRLLSCN